jgi:hypothetical protein
MPSADGEANAGDRTYLVLAEPNVIMNDIRLRGLGVAGSGAAGLSEVGHQSSEAGFLLRRGPTCASTFKSLCGAGGSHWPLTPAGHHD